MTFVKESKEDFIQEGAVEVGIGTTTMGPCNEREWAQLQTQQEQIWNL